MPEKFSRQVVRDVGGDVIKVMFLRSNQLVARSSMAFILQFLSGLSMLLLYLQCPANARESSAVPKIADIGEKCPSR
jgi:hypothetical protein